MAGAEGETVDGGTIRAALAEYDALYDTLIGRQGFLVRLFAPKLQWLVVRFPAGREGESVGRGSGTAERYRTDERHELTVSLNAYFLYDNFRCGVVPDEVLLSADR